MSGPERVLSQTMELFLIFLFLLVVYGGGWIWQTVGDLFQDLRQEGGAPGLREPGRGSRNRRGILRGPELESLRNAFAAVARDLDGQLHDRAPSDSPKVSFVHRTSRALLSLYEARQASRLYTQTTFTIPPGWRHRLEIFPQRFLDEEGGGGDPGDVRIGDEEFDRRFVVRTDDQDFAREYLDSAARGWIERLRGLAGNEGILVSLNPARLLIRKPAVFAETEVLRAFVDLSRLLFDRIYDRWQKESGIEILEGTAPESSVSVCQVCGAGLEDRSVVFCRSCRTPHHDECWNYNGGCSTFACGEKTFVKKP